MRIIVRMPNWIGDLVMAIPILIELRSVFPKAHITAMCKKSLAPLLEKEEAISEILLFDKNAAAKMRKKRYDLGILLTNSLSSTLCFWKGRVKKRVGFIRWPRVLFLTKAVSWPKNLEKMHLVDTYKTLLKAIGINPKGHAPRIILEPSEIEEARQKIPPGCTLIGMNPGAAYGTAKCWPKERFQELTADLLKWKSNVVVFFFGDSSSLEMIEDIVSPFKERVINLCGKTTLRELASLISLCNVFVSNDSGPMHIAAALRVPLIALFGSTSDVKTGPYHWGEVIHKHVACSPCYKRVCPIDFRCMKQIKCDEVLKKIIKISV